ncbi:sulfatase [Paenibacillus sp. F411]|uniref:sulfatase family protein n=1 Tax=Paenibacillus sp. F411 TaxID=2820239 RepID=UPI001AAECC6C|nr:sulfatase [Paenibacillus sp. F411]MBO2945598.1 sulfatase [Paenibacillus sp. F411]
MNIIYLHTHDTGRYIQPYGYAVPTPNLMELARGGTLFRQAFCAAPTCSPSRAALLTGMAPHSNGMLGLTHRGFLLNDYKEHLVSFLEDQGYETALCGVQHEAPDKAILGYEHLLEPEAAPEQEHEDVRCAERAAAYIREDRERPFFLSLGLFNTHREFPERDPEVNPNYVLPPHPFPDTAQNREDMANYISSAKLMDRCVGIVMEALKASGQEDSTLLIFTTDHGLAFPHMKCSLYDTGIGVALMMKKPGLIRAGHVEDSLVSQVDLFPTLCDMLGVEQPERLQGVSLLPLIEGSRDKVREEIFAEVTFHAAYEPMRCIRTDRYKLIRWFDEHDGLVPANIDDSPTKSFLVEQGLLSTRREPVELYDLYLDPVERVNVVRDEAYAGIYQDLSSRLMAWMEETGDPLLHGKVQKPEGARINKVSCVSNQVPDYE